MPYFLVRYQVLKRHHSRVTIIPWLWTAKFERLAFEVGKAIQEAIRQIWDRGASLTQRSEYLSDHQIGAESNTSFGKLAVVSFDSYSQVDLKWPTFLFSSRTGSPRNHLVPESFVMPVKQWIRPLLRPYPIAIIKKSGEPFPFSAFCKQVVRRRHEVFQPVARWRS